VNLRVEAYFVDFEGVWQAELEAALDHSDWRNNTDSTLARTTGGPKVAHFAAICLSEENRVKSRNVALAQSVDRPECPSAGQHREMAALPSVEKTLRFAASALCCALAQCEP